MIDDTLKTREKEWKLASEIVEAIRKNDIAIEPDDYICKSHILTLIKEALPALAKDNGYVKLAKDQTLPKNPYNTSYSTEVSKYYNVAYDMLKGDSTGKWRKVELEE